jgi:eukaryotic-like serine/threonine-protein kinase
MFVTAIDFPFTDALRDRYALEKELGRGGMATVYLARDLRHKRHVALKVLHPDLSYSVGADRFLREIETVASLTHPHLLPLHDSGEAAGLLYYVMPYVEGESLRDRLRRETQLPVEEALRIARQVADGLHYAHQHGVIHRDIKPENILLSGGHALVADFGIARALGEAGGEQLTEPGLAVGTVAYMAPEQASGGQVDGRADVYALGCVVYEMLAGEPPFTGPTPQAIVAKRVLGPVPPVRTTRPDVPTGLDAALLKALAPIPAARFVNMADFGQALAHAPSLQDTTPIPRAVAAQTSRPAWRSRRLAAFGLATLILLSLGVSVLLWRTRAASRTLEADLLAVAPFDVLDPNLQLWREGLVDLLARNLDGAGPLRTVPPTTVVRRWEGHADPLAAAELGRRTGAGLALFGSLVSVGGDSVRIRATLLDVVTDRPLAELELHDAAERIDRLGDSLAVRVLGELGRHRRLELTRIASLGSASPPALKAFLQGEQWFRRTAWDSATVSYERAVALDSNFALALWRLGRVLGWQRTGGESLSVALAVRAGSVNRGLAPRDSLLVAVDSMREADLPASWSWYRRVRGTALEAVRRYPDDADAWHTLGEVLLHAGLTRGVAPREALAVFERAIGLDSAYAPAYIHAIELASRIHGIESARWYASAYLRRAPGDVTAEGIRLALDLSDARRARSPEVQRALRQASANVLFKAWLPFFGATDSGEVAVQAGRALVSSHDTSSRWLTDPVRRYLVIPTLTYRGHLREAARVWRPDIPAPWESLGELGLLGQELPKGAAALLADSLRAGSPDVVRGGPLLLTAHGDTAALTRVAHLADSAAHSAPDSLTRERSVYGAAAARAYLALARRDTTEALRRFEMLPDSLCGSCYLDAVTRLLLLAARGKDRRVVDASGWEAYTPSGSVVLGRLAQARAAERLGERERAIREYQFVADAWRNADPDLQPYVVEARRALGGLTGEPRP